MVNQEFKKRVIEAIKEDRKRFDSNAKQSKSLGINASQLSRIINGELERVISDSKWVTLGRKLGIDVNPGKAWATAKTETFDYITTQLTFCKENSESRILCDIAGVGKTHTAKYFTKKNKDTVYIDCSQVKSKQKLIRKIAQEFGVDSVGKYSDVYDDLVYYLVSITNQKPLLILDEAGDLAYPAFLELKALWNATEHGAGFYMMGADGLKAKIESNRGRKKVGYAEIFDRFGDSYKKCSPDGKEALEKFKREHIALITRANSPKANVQTVYLRTGGSLRRIRTEIKKLA